MDLWNIKNQATGCKPQLVLDFSHHQFYWPLFNTQCSIHVLLTNTDTHQPNSCPSVPQKKQGWGQQQQRQQSNNVCPFIGSTGSKRRQQLLVGSQVFNSLYLCFLMCITWSIHWLLLFCSKGRNWPSDGFGAWSKRFQCDGSLEEISDVHKVFFLRLCQASDHIVVF